MVHVPSDVGARRGAAGHMSLKLLAMRLVQPLAGRFPRVFYPVATAVGWLAFYLRRRYRRKLIQNMLPLVDRQPARAKRSALAASVNVCQYYVDLCTLPYRNIATFDATNLEIAGADRLGPLSEPGPVIAVSAHTGNAELAIQALSVRGRPFVALVEPQRPPSWSRYLLRLRSSAGGRFYETNFRGIRACIETLQRGGLVGFMADRDLQGNGMCVPLAGQCVRLPRGPWEIARRSGALVFPMFTSRLRHDRFRVYVEEPFRVARSEDEEADILDAIQRFARLLETHLRRDPSQWAVTEDFWEVHRCG